jgi:N-carbamoylputrescine amidase
MSEEMIRPYTIVAIQGGPNTDDKEENLKKYLNLVDEAAKKKPDLIAFGEVFCTKAFFTVENPKFYELAERLPGGPTSEAMGEKAKKYGCYIVGGFYEKGSLKGEYYNSAFVMGPDGKPVQGTLPDGRKVICYRKCHIPLIMPKTSYEKCYIKPGPGFSLFDLGKTRIGILICADTSWLEGWRAVALQGAEILVSVTSARTIFMESFDINIRAAAITNRMYVLFANRGGTEERAAPEGVEWDWYGKSSIVDVSGKIIDEGPFKEGPAIVSTTIDLERAGRSWRDRRPEIYKILSEEVGLL